MGGVWRRCLNLLQKPSLKNVNTWKDSGLTALEGGDPERTLPSVKWCLPVTFERTFEISSFVTDSAATVPRQRASCAEYLALGLTTVTSNSVAVACNASGNDELQRQLV